MSQDADNTNPELSPVAALRTLRAVLADTELSLAERVAVAAVILAADNKDATAWASYRAIRAEYGISSDSIAAAIRKATGRWLTICGSGRRGARRYRVLPPSPPERSGQQSAALRSPVQSAPATGAERSGHRSDSYPFSGPISSSRAAAVRADLQEAGIGEPALTRLADLPGLSPELVRSTVEQTRRDGGRNGLLVRRLEEAATAAVTQEAEQARAAAAAAARDQARERARQADAEQLETIERERLERAAIIEALSRDELARLTAEVLTTAPTMHRDRWRKADPRTNTVLQIAIVDRWRREQEASATRPDDDTPEAGAPDNGPDRPAGPGHDDTGG